MRTKHPITVTLLILSWILAGFCSSYAQQADPNLKALEDRIDNTVRERGVLQSAESVELRCEVTGGSTILKVVPEGTRVAEGDLLLELDDSALREQLKAAQIAVRQAAAELEHSRQRREVAKMDQEVQIRVLEIELRGAELARQKVLGDGGELACQLIRVQSELAVAQQRLKVAESLLNAAPGGQGGKPLVDLRLMAFEAREAVKVAEARKRFLEKHEQPHQAAVLDGAIALKKLQLTRQQRVLDGQMRAAEASLVAQETMTSLATDRLKQLEQQMASCKVLAPKSGIVIYATVTASRANRPPAIAEGAAVREGQPLICIPDLSKLEVKVLVNETRISRLRVGQPARILCDALPDRPLKGRVVRVSDVPEPSSWLTGDTKEYAAIVSIDESLDLLRVGLTALVEIDTQ